MNYSFLNIYVVVGVVAFALIAFILYRILKTKVKVPEKFRKNIKVRAKEEVEEVNVKANIPAEEGKYKAYIWDSEGIHPGRIEKPIGKVWYAEPTMPESGQCYFVRKDDKGKMTPYDPREHALDKDERPQELYDALNWRYEVNGVYSIASSIWDKINMLLPYVAAFLFFIVMAMAIDKVVK